MAGLAMTEHGNIDSHTQFERAAKKAGVKSVFGVEVYMPANVVGEGETQRKHHLTLIARTPEGYHNIIKLVTASWENFYHGPTVTLAMLKKFRRGVIALSGCQSSLLFCSTVGGKGIEEKDASFRRGLAVARMFKNILGKWFFIEVQAFPELKKTCQFNALAGKIARAIGTKLVATMDCHYCVLEEQEVQKILHNLRPGNKQTIEERARVWGYDVPLCPPPNDRSIYRKLRATGLSKEEAIEAIVTTEELAQECNVELPQLPMVKFPLPEGYTDPVTYWRDLLRMGWKFRGLHKLAKAEQKAYKDRLIVERDLIESKDFVNYFLLVQAGVRHIKELNIPVGPARGSAAASVAAWLLRITEVDPLREDFGGLLRFERFIDESREDLPDIDLDFPSRARPILRRFYEKLLGGSERVTNVGTFTYFRNKMALDDVARVFRVPKWEVEKVKNYLIERSSADLRASSTVEDTIAQFPAAAEVIERHPELSKAALLEGGIKGFGVHAAALVLSNDPISDVTSIATREVPKGSGNVVQVVGLDKRDAEYRGLLKMDFLGLNTMSMIEDMIKHPLVEMDINELYGLPLRDEKIYDRFEENDVVGIFQWDGRATRFVNGAVKPRIFRELMDINALSRPGPLHGGGTREYIETKHGRQKPESLHPALDIITAPTQYQIVYQEQILSILRTVGNFPWGVTAEIRKIISKKFGEQAFNAKKAQFMEGVATVHKRFDFPRMNEETGDKIWRRMITAGSYAFNAAHCLAGDTTVEIVGGDNGSPNAKKKVTLKELWDRMYGLPMASQEGRVGRYAKKYEGPCMRCGESQTFMRGWCRRCYRWRQKMFERGLRIYAYHEDGMIRADNIVNIYHNGIRKVYKVLLTNGNFIRATKDHRILTEDGWREVRNLRKGIEVVIDSGARVVTYRGHNRLGPGGSSSWKRWRASVPNKCEHCGFGHKRLETSHKNADRTDNRTENLQLLCPTCHRAYDRDYNDSSHANRGHEAATAKVVSITYAGEEEVFDLEMESSGHNFVANNIVVHNCASYSLIAYYCMFFKVYHPSVFYYAALKNLSRDKRKELIRDAEQHHVRILPPSLQRSRITWHTRSRQSVRAGFQEVEGIGPKMAPLIISERRSRPYGKWDDLTRIKGIGPKKVQSIVEFATKDDPFDVYKLERNIAKVKKEIMKGRLGPLPVPTHNGAQIDENPGKRIPVVWLGTITNRNVRDLFEYTMSKTGEELDPKTVKDPELREWVVCRGEDDTEPVMLKINRWRYPQFKNAIMGAEMEQDLVLVQGLRPEFAGTRQINVTHIWIIAPDEDEDPPKEDQIAKQRHERSTTRSSSRLNGRKTKAA